MPSNEKHNELDKMADYSDQQAQDTLALRATYEELLQLQRDTGRWNMLYELSRSLALQQDLPTLLRLIIECASTLLNSSGGVLYLYNSQEHSLEVAAVKNFPFPVGTRLSWSNDGIEKLFESQRSGFLPILEAPMCFGGDQIGILAVSRPVNDEVDFTKEDERILSLFAGYAASAIRNLYLPAQPQPILGKLQALHYMNLVINSSMDLHLTLDELIKQITTQLNVDAAAVFLLDMSFQRLEYASGMGFQVVNFKHNHLNLNWDYAGLAAHPRRVINCSEPTREIRDPVRVSLMTKEGFNSYCTVPLIAKGIPKGILEIYHRTALVRNAEWFDYLETLATQIAIAIDNDTLFHNMQRSNAELETVYDATLKSWTNALELRNIETEGHCQRVMELTLRLAHLMGISDVDLACMRRGALLHDVGKIGIPDNILFKPGQLTEKEWAIVRQHPAYTYELLSSYPFMRLAMDIPLHHHERWDGSGYPNGLAGEQIPLAARIFAIIDVWDALLSERPYRKAWSIDQVLAYIRSEKGKQFDPHVADAFLSLVV